MSARLSKSEREQLKGILRQYEKSVRMWPWYRWIVLSLAVLILASSVYSGWRLDSFVKDTRFPAQRIEESKGVKLLAARERIVKTEVSLRSQTTFLGVGGAILLVYSLVGWRGRAIEIAMVACLRELLSSDSMQDDDT